MIHYIDFDQEGRVVRTIQNFQPDATRSFALDTYQNIVVERMYGPGGQLAKLTAQNPGTEPQVMLDYATGSGTNPYAGFDRFGRVIDHWWHRPFSSSSSSASSGVPSDDIVHLKYGYDRASNRTYRRDEVARGYGQNYDELYQYDNLQRLTGFYRGSLTVDNQALSTATASQNWTLDSTGNWRAFNQNADGTFLTQQRSANEANEITSIKHVVSDAWATPKYDGAGNMTILPRPLDPVEDFTATYE